MGEMSETWEHVLLATSILVGTFFITLVIRRTLKSFLDKRAEKLKIEKTNYRFLYNTINLVVFTAALIVIFSVIPELKKISVPLFAGAGILTVVIGFASQQAFSNIVSGIFIVLFKPFRVGDIVAIGTDRLGTVEDITLRHTVINNFENKRIIIPNSVMSSETIVNWNITDQKVRNHIEFGISYDSNVDLAIDIIREESMKHPLCIDNRSDEDKQKGIPAVLIRMISWADSAVILKAWVWSDDPPKGVEMKCDLLKSIKVRFDQEGIEIPFPHRTLVYKNGDGKS